VARNNRLAGRDFFPALTIDQKILISRHDVEKKLEPFQSKIAACEIVSRKN
jgi:hypothetical protein